MNFDKVIIFNVSGSYSPWIWQYSNLCYKSIRALIQIWLIVNLAWKSTLPQCDQICVRFKREKSVNIIWSDTSSLELPVRFKPLPLLCLIKNKGDIHDFTISCNRNNEQNCKNWILFKLKKTTISSSFNGDSLKAITTFPINRDWEIRIKFYD